MLDRWPTPSFFEQGAFLGLSDGNILLGKGGHVTQLSTGPLPVGSFLLKDFFEDRYLAYTPEATIKVRPEEFVAMLPSEEVHVIESCEYDDLWTKDYEQLQSSLDQHLRKVVLISREEFKVSNAHSAKMSLIRKAVEFGVGVPFGFWTKDYGVIGSTPEVLFQTKNQSISTFALAGTAKSGQESALMGSSKDRLEHDLVIQDISEKLAPFCLKLERNETCLYSYKDLIHLKTNIQGELKENIDFRELTSLLSPTAALGGHPKVEAMNFLRKSHYSRRFPNRYFGSALGYLDEGQIEFVVCIRSVQWQEDIFFIESGGGVVSSSDFQQELSEIKLKRDTVKGHYL